MRITSETTERDILEKLEVLFEEVGICMSVRIEEDEDGECYFDDAGFFIIDDVITHWRASDIKEIVYRNDDRVGEGERGYLKFYFCDGSWLSIYNNTDFSYKLYFTDGDYYEQYGVEKEVFEAVECYIREGREHSLFEDQFLISSDKNVLVKCLKTTKEIVVPANIKEIAPYAFKYCDFESITLPDGLRKIGDSAFSGCEYVSEIHIPDTCTDLGRFAFDYCKKLKRVRLSPKCSSLPYRIFYKCTMLEEISGADLGKVIINKDALEGTPLEVHNAE